jgi:hypothetical protein
VVRSKLSNRPFGQREEALFESAQRDLPTWRMANQARRHLAGVAGELMDSIPAPTESIAITETDATTARQIAAVRLAVIVVRTVSGLMSQLACGHEREALAGGRTIMEALIRARQVSDDKSASPHARCSRVESPDRSRPRQSATDIAQRSRSSIASRTPTCSPSWWSRSGARAASRQT